MMRYKRVLVVSNMYPSKKDPTYGIFIKNFCGQLDTLGVNYDISAMSKSHHPVEKILKYISFFLITFVKCLFGKYDLVYIHFPSFSAPTVLLARRRRSFEIITNVHGEDVIPHTVKQTKMLSFSKRAFDISRLIVSPSIYYKKILQERYNVEEERIVVYPSGGINEEVFYPLDSEKRNRVREEYGINEACFVIGFVGRIEHDKGWNVLLDALEKCKCIYSDDCRVIIVGNGAEEAAMQSEIDRLPECARSSVIRLPLLVHNRLAQIYNIFDVLVFPSMREAESLGLVALEAMSCGIPIIASDFAAQKYYVEHGINGFKFKSGDSTDLARNIDCFAEKKKDNEIMKLINGALDTAKMYNTKNAAKALRAIFE